MSESVDVCLVKVNKKDPQVFADMVAKAYCALHGKPPTPEEMETVRQSFEKKFAEESQPTNPAPVVSPTNATTNRDDSAEPERT